jgi:hypothetical protein
MGTLENHHQKNVVISIGYEEIRFRPWAPLALPEFAIAAPVLKFDEPALLVVVVVSHGSQSRFDDLSHKDQDWAAKAGIARHDRQPFCEMTLLSS